MESESMPHQEDGHNVPKAKLVDSRSSREMLAVRVADLPELPPSRLVGLFPASIERALKRGLRKPLLPR